MTIHWEAHACLPLHPRADFSPLDSLRAAGVHYVSVNVGMDMNPVAQILSVLAGFRARIAARPERLRLVASVAEIRAAAAAGVLAVGFDLEGALPLLEQPDMVALYRDLGVRQIHFAYNRNNSVADGCHDAQRGLTPLGRRMVRAVNEAGLLMDCAHTGRRCSLDIMAASAKPVVFSHANPLALVEHGRNVSDEQIRACAATGGVVCISGVSAFLGTRTPGAGDVARHAAHVANLVGAQHVGIGLDIGFRQNELNDDPPGDHDPDYWWPRAAGYNRAVERMRYTPVETWQVLSGALQEVGMSAAEAAAVMGGNMLRVAGQVW
ncbi:dipeptidase [Verminephrobacter aporrectodeae]|uniref:Peptidase M19 n=1 Tax=Verminephrobacter aporrectodeae subsp. tuberculatae TaxID=1110392 RepID=A0ABT3KWV1_9BURK|nr:membrane dipeptidase [Verminephrobacter aporrectodeae]MCW5222059.1 peptidase M19 [Verminephrobacter aporrectodeae subsp. tuberculatae]MCW5258369.1 peptidase M19 [Verminephrobacter aporrectodeae subsp. tuberculatae]MCW5291350.1 peptidase M19 [Verminephrobacter aporrectodeae subsp. tuberculatae]MCW5322492.1 peptidase M19 [Verminephrobacter aporrectodeae subsp. tuberculatae]MCW8166849.1 peptidase M19 [Verminephrobacter aporrectodeae subsp. tuberculatae]